eukprot:431594-Amorphochlora_amoeboformis.AAC.2
MSQRPVTQDCHMDVVAAARLKYWFLLVTQPDDPRQEGITDWKVRAIELVEDRDRTDERLDRNG